MPTPSNIDRFNKVTLLALDTLYQAFPVPTDLDVAAMAMESLPADADFDESFKSIEPAYWAIDFLISEGFITHKDKTLDGHSFCAARLTSKAFAVLGSTPAALEHQQSIAEKVRSLLKTGAKGAASETAKKLVELIFNNAPVLTNLVSSTPLP